MKTAREVKEYEVKEYRKAFLNGTNEAWKRYRANVKRAVNKYNKEYGKENGEIDINMIMA